MFWRKKTDTEQIKWRTEKHHIRTVIDGKLYDTEKSEYMSIIDEERLLFKTPNGNYFSCDTKYSNTIMAYERILSVYYYDIEPESIERAKDAIGRYDVDKYIELFGEPEPA